MSKVIEYQEFLRYKEMKKQKEMEMENRQQIKKEQYNNNINNEIRGNRNDYYEYEKQPKEYLNQYQNYQNNNQNINDNRNNMNNNFHYDEQSETSKRFNEIKEKENFSISFKIRGKIIIPKSKTGTNSSIL